MRLLFIGMGLVTLFILLALGGCGIHNYSPSFPLLVLAPQPCDGVKLSDGTCVGYLERVSGFDRVIIERHNAAVEKETQ